MTGKERFISVSIRRPHRSDKSPSAGDDPALGGLAGEATAASAGPALCRPTRRIQAVLGDLGVLRGEKASLQGPGEVLLKDQEVGQVHVAVAVQVGVHTRKTSGRRRVAAAPEAKLKLREVAQVYIPVEVKIT